MSERPPELVLVSDLHIGRGKNPQTGRYFELETFFYDDDFRRFCLWLCADARERGVDLRLILNGDTFDLLRIDPVVTDARPTSRERRYGPVMTPPRAAAVIREVLVGHAEFVDGLAEVLVAGHEVIFLPGNHDLEIQWPAVQQEIRASILEHAARIDPGQARGAIDGRLRFAPWFHYEPGRVWIEHGCQYDPQNAFRYNLRTNHNDEEATVVAAEEDMPLGNFFQRYLYNAFGHITFIVPSTRANLRYVKWLLVHQPELLARAAASHGRFWWQVVRRLALTAPEVRRRLRDLHAAELDALAASSGLGPRLKEIDGLKRVGGDITTTVRTLGWQIVKDLLQALTILLAAAGLWFAGFHMINHASEGFMVKAVFFLLLDFFFLIIVLAGIGYAILRPPSEPAARPLRRAAQTIADRLGVPLVCFGHTHEEVLWRLRTRSGAPAWYFNSGTWIAVFTHDVLLPRERVQYTFIRVEGTEARLQHWSPGRGLPLPVILLDERDEDVSAALAEASTTQGRTE
ncbi:MAG: metallophosphoesterase [Nannocystaceae bacterium]